MTQLTHDWVSAQPYFSEDAPAGDPPFVMIRFTRNNQGFICRACGTTVLPHPSSSRDHCNHCLTGQHVDLNPGDRLNECRGVLEPIGLQTKSGKTKIVYRCCKCHEQVFNIVAPDDNAELITELAGMSW